MENNQNVEKMGFFSKVINSMTKSETYVHLVKESFGKAVIYLLLISVILGLATAARYTYNYNQGLGKVINSLNEKMPEFTLSNGELKIDDKMPIIFNGDNSNDVIYIDTEENNIDGVMKKYNSGIFITKDRVTQKQVGGRMQITNFSELQGATLTKPDLLGFIGIAKVFGAVIIFGFPICFFVGKFMSALVVAFLAFIADAIFVKSRVKFGDIYKLAFYALTLSMILKTVSILIGIEIPFFRWSGHIDLLYYVLGAVYLVLGLKAIRHHEDALETEEL